jgi:putative peptidoglycan lipid II flippase
LTVSRPPLLAHSAGLTGAATLVSRILGLLRDQVLAAIFGASNDMDAFVVAFRIPNLVRDLFAEGAMSAAFVPTFTERLALDGKNNAWRLANNLLGALLVTTSALVVLGIVFARPLVTLYAGDFARVPGKVDLTIRLTRMLLPFLPMVAGAAALMGMLNSLHYFCAGAGAGAFQHRHHRLRVSPRAVDAGARIASDYRHRDWSAAWRRAAGARAVAAAAAGGVPVSLHVRCA